MNRTRLIIALLLCWCSMPAVAHKLAPALLDITPQGDSDYSTLWRLGLQTPPLTLQWPDGCKEGPQTISQQGTALDRRYTLSCDQALDGRTLNIEGLEAARTAVLVRLHNAQNTQQTLVTAANPKHRFSARHASDSVVLEYLVLGIEHILIGLDHLLLVLGLFLITHGWRALAANVTAFTLGHSITLAAVSLDAIRVPSTWVEFTIAATILALALSLSRKPANRGGQQWLIFSIFGLIHGMGFAGVLGDIGLPKQDLLAALLAFNLGIEVGQLAFLAALAALFALAAKIHKQVNKATQTLAVYSMGGLASFWCIERGLSLLN